MTKATISPFVKNINHKDTKKTHRCKYCDMAFSHKDRKDNHERSCRTTCFNFFHKLVNNRFEDKLIFQGLESIKCNICDDEEYSDFIKPMNYIKPKKNNNSAIVTSEQQITNQNTFCRNNKKLNIFESKYLIEYEVNYLKVNNSNDDEFYNMLDEFDNDVIDNIVLTNIITSDSDINNDVHNIDCSEPSLPTKEECIIKEFTKDEVYAGKIKLLLDKTFHSSIEDAITKYKELQKILNESI